jgi:hypothetical protein
MNFKKISKTLLILPLLMGCSDFLDINTSPNSPSDVPLSTILPSAQVGTGFMNANELNRFGLTVSDYMYGAGGSPANYDTYQITGGDFGNQWTGEIWNGALIQYKQIIDKGNETGANNYVGVAKIMQAYTWAATTDIWGDIPYSKALRGNDGITRPELDLQEDIYKGNSSKEIKGLFELIREGLAALDQPTTLTMGTDDVIFSGNLANWKKAGNTLMLRLATTISVKEPALAKSIIDEVVAKNNFISANTQNLSVNFGGSVGSQSPLYSYMYVTTFQNEMIVSTRFLNLLQNANDPRLPLFLKKGTTTATSGVPTATYVTFDNGYRGTLPSTFTFTKLGDAVVGTNGVGPIRLVTNAGRAFMLAEAIIRLGVVVPGQTAQTLFYEGIRASLTEAGVAATAIDAYIGANAASATTVAKLAGTSDQMIDQIITQKYIAMTGNGLEAWNDIRRTGFPSHTAVEHANAAGEDGKRPVRARYPDADIARNPNLGAAVQKTNVKVWWDAN